MLQKSPIFAYLPARDVKRARQFYEQKLGFKPKREVAGGVVYEFAGATACFLYPTPNAGTSRASQAFLASRGRRTRSRRAERQGRGVRGIRHARSQDPEQHRDR